ncbi:MAG: fumarylacetoacetase [Rhodobacteraceae bacterium]|nr:fumarylacetoacetase [Paracoccaceae bacterium]
MIEPSWVESANQETSDFPLNNLPHGVFSRRNAPGSGRRLGIAIGDAVLDIAALAKEQVIGAPAGAENALVEPAWNHFMACGPRAWQDFRARLRELLAADGPETDRAAVSRAMVPLADVDLHLPFVVAEYTDFYSGRHHATNVGTMFRGAENALPPSWLHMPIGYNGRASTVVVSGTPVHRPWGQLKPPGRDAPEFAPCRRFDFELEMGAVVGLPSTMGRPVSVAEAETMIFGYVLLNDWSARDIQTWEYRPLGPFQAKATATTISPWIVTPAALEPFRVSGPERDRELLPYLHEPGPMMFDIDLEVTLRPDGAAADTTLTQTNFRELYFSPAQQICHHSSSGCRMSAGDLIGSGTISGPNPENRGSFLELAWGGKEPVGLAEGGTRVFLEDGDRVSMTGRAQGKGFRVGFGSCNGTVLPAIKYPGLGN